MCGEHQAYGSDNRHAEGSSPHVRGARPRVEAPRGADGIIPACAGSTTRASSRTARGRDHPRMCGEHGVAGADVEHGAGIIPACAGSTSAPSSTAPGWRDHPRMCGEHVWPARMLSTSQGSSPHVRGARGRGQGQVRLPGIIPACAGSTTSPRASAARRRDHPRMCGEHNTLSVTLDVPQGSSPHVRGAPPPQGGRAAGRGIIPACAGSTDVRVPKKLLGEDHPRMCGEHFLSCCW